MVKKRIENLIAKIEASNDMTNSKDDLKHVEETINDCASYVETVVNMENAITTARFRLEPEEYQQYLTRLDQSRKLSHDSLIVSVRVLNRFCRLYDCEPVFEGDTGSRVQIAEFARGVTVNYFDERKKAR